jgi:hypothetical protein
MASNLPKSKLPSLRDRKSRLISPIIAWVSSGVLGECGQTKPTVGDTGRQETRVESKVAAFGPLLCGSEELAFAQWPVLAIATVSRYGTEPNARPHTQSRLPRCVGLAATCSGTQNR